MTTTLPDVADPFCHEALFYAGDEEFLRATTRLITDGLEAGEPTLVVVSAAKIEALRATLPPCEDTVTFADMADVGANPGRIIPAWRDFVGKYAGTGVRLRDIGQPVWPERGCGRAPRVPEARNASQRRLCGRSGFQAPLSLRCDRARTRGAC